MTLRVMLVDESLERAQVVKQTCALRASYGIPACADADDRR
jgi:hypothetical protein